MSDQKPTPISIAIHSTPLYANDVLFRRAMDECRARFNLVRVIAEQGSAVAAMARHWCRRNGVHLTIVLKDESVAEAFDRCRRWSQIVEEKPAAFLVFNSALRWLHAANRLHAAGVPVSLVRPTDQNSPRFITWSPGMADVPATPDMQTVARNVRRARPRKKLSAEEGQRRQKVAKETWREQQRVKRTATGPAGLAFGAIPRKRKRRATG